MPFQTPGGDRRPVTSPSSSPFLSHMRGAFGTEMVRVLRNPGTEDEESFETEAHIQGKTGSFDINTPVPHRGGSGRASPPSPAAKPGDQRRPQRARADVVGRPVRINDGQ